MTDAQLKPCPFCGATMKDWHGVSFAHPLVDSRADSCILAGLSFSYTHSRWGTDEKMRWNRRADLPATRAQIAASPEVRALVEALEKIDVGQSAMPDHWKYRLMARLVSRAALAAFKATPPHPPATDIDDPLNEIAPLPRGEV